MADEIGVAMSEEDFALLCGLQELVKTVRRFLDEGDFARARSTSTTPSRSSAANRPRHAVAARGDSRSLWHHSATPRNVPQGAYASWQEVGLRRKTALVAAGISVTVSAALVVRVIAIGKPGVVLILAPAIVGSLLALWRPDHRGFLSVAAALNVLTAGVSLIGGVGLLYVPSIVLLIWSAIPKSAPQAT